MKKVISISRRGLLQTAVGALGYAKCAHAGGAQHVAIAVNQKDAASKPMMTYIGTPTSRVDGRAKVTGEAKYAGEFNASGLAHASVVASTIAKGRILRIDAGEALRVDGVIDVLTHEHRPHMADTDRAYKDDVAPPGG
jgi:xanthine dehydrogenase YagR molybdenum-binding subunit